jgi:hypothetical protein
MLECEQIFQALVSLVKDGKIFPVEHTTVIDQSYQPVSLDEARLKAELTVSTGSSQRKRGKKTTSRIGVVSETIRHSAANACPTVVPYRQGKRALLQGKLQGKIRISISPRIAPSRTAAPGACAATHGLGLPVFDYLTAAD